MDFLSQTYIALRGPTGAPQSATDTIAKLSDRLSPSTLLADRRAAVLSLKGLTRDCKAEVGDRALPGLLNVLQNDAEIDADIGKAAIETLQHLCEPEEASRELSLKHTDYFLANEQATHTLFTLLGNSHFYIRYATLQFLSTLLQNRRSVVQGYFLKAPNGAPSIISVLEDKREIIRNESIVMIQLLISQSPDIQKVLAFEGAFEKLFNTVSQEGGVEGGIIAYDALRCVDGLLRLNSSNQSYFRETSLPVLLCSLLVFPPNQQLQDSAPQEFALQFWDQQKAANVSLIIGIMGMLVGSKGSSNKETTVFALRLLPGNLTFPLSDVVVTPYMPVPETNGEEWDRLEPASALDALVELALHGEYNGLCSDRRLKDGLELRGASFERIQQEIKQMIIQGMLPREAPTETPMISPLLHALCLPPTSPLNVANVTTTHFASLLFAQLLSSSPRSKTVARSINPSPALHVSTPSQSQFFVPADGTPSSSVPDPDDEDAPQSLISLLSENLSALLPVQVARRRRERKRGKGMGAIDCGWLWEDPKAVREFLEAGGLGVLVEPINQTTEGESLIPGPRSTPIISRLSVDALIGQMTRFREDDRFKSVTPELVVLPYPTPGGLASNHNQNANQNPAEQEGELWFDWAFVDFWKSNHYTVQRGLNADPSALPSSSTGPDAESAMLISSLRDVIRRQAQEIEALQGKLRDLSTSTSNQPTWNPPLQESEGRKKEVEKEQEDLLVLLDETSTKWSRDKERMREAGLEVSEDEGDERWMKRRKRMGRSDWLIRGWCACVRFEVGLVVLFLAR
ncbi:hypothetical protein BU15DRAFT_65006 [Melanogaster broomeanus]|nr:hypothetical protein BU15DRAFT_65006 [Melanogaster broomeanus]